MNIKKQDKEIDYSKPKGDSWNRMCDPKLYSEPWSKFEQEAFKNVDPDVLKDIQEKNKKMVEWMSK